MKGDFKRTLYILSKANNILEIKMCTVDKILSCLLSVGKYRIVHIINTNQSKWISFSTPPNQSDTNYQDQPIKVLSMHSQPIHVVHAPPPPNTPIQDLNYIVAFWHNLHMTHAWTVNYPDITSEVKNSWKDGTWNVDLTTLCCKHTRLSIKSY